MKSDIIALKGELNVSLLIFTFELQTTSKSTTDGHCIIVWVKFESVTERINALYKDVT